MATHVRITMGCATSDGRWAPYTVHVPGSVADRGRDAVVAWAVENYFNEVRGVASVWVHHYDADDVGVDLSDVIELTPGRQVQLLGLGADVRVSATDAGISVSIYADDAEPPDAVAEAWATWGELRGDDGGEA